MINYASSQRRAAPACPEPHQHRRPPEPKPFIFVFKTEGEILKPAPGQVLKGSTNSEEACSCSSHPSCFRREASGRDPPAAPSLGFRVLGQMFWIPPPTAGQSQRQPGARGGFPPFSFPPGLTPPHWLCRLVPKAHLGRISPSRASGITQT